MENWHTPYKTVQLPHAEKVLVFAPHPDDEVFGCGGALALYAQQGIQIEVHVITDGAGYAVGDERLRLQQTRQAETVNALKKLQITAVCFWSLADRSLAGHAGLVKKLLKVLTSTSPQVVMAPSLDEIHPDHLGLARATLAAIQLMPPAYEKPLVLQYEIGSMLKPDLLIDITTVWGIKQQAMQTFASQMLNQDYARHIEALNTYRTYTLDRSVQYAEAYRCVTWNEPCSVTGVMNPKTCVVDWTLQVLAAADAQAETLQNQVVLLQQIQQKTCEELAAKVVEFGDAVVKFSEFKLLSDQLQSQLDQLRQVHGATIQENKFLLDRMHSLESSKSWRITRPLRWLVSKFTKRN